MGMWSKLMFWIGTSLNIWLILYLMIFRDDWFLAFWLAFLTVALFVIFADERKGLPNERADHRGTGTGFGLPAGFDSASGDD